MKSATKLTAFVKKLDPAKFKSDGAILSECLGITREEIVQGFKLADDVLKKNIGEDGRSGIELVDKIQTDERPEVPGSNVSIAEVFRDNMITLGPLEGFLVGYSFAKKFQKVQFRRGLTIVSGFEYKHLWDKDKSPINFITKVAAKIKINRESHDLSEALGISPEDWREVKRATAAIVSKYYNEINNRYPLRLPTDFVTGVSVMEDKIITFDRKTDLREASPDVSDAGFLFSVAALEVSEAAVQSLIDTMHQMGS